jgi:hypothetical protein
MKRLFLLLAATLAAKAAVLAQIGSHPLLQPLGDIDSGVYARLASRIAGGDVLLRGEGAVPYFVSPLYAYVLAATGPSFPLARAAQILLGTAAVALVFLTARRLFGERAALAAAVLYALAGVVTFHEVLILQAAIDPFLTALALFLLARAVGGEEEEKISLKVKRGEARESGVTDLDPGLCSRGLFGNFGYQHTMVDVQRHKHRLGQFVGVDPEPTSLDLSRIASSALSGRGR